MLYPLLRRERWQASQKSSDSIAKSDRRCAEGISASGWSHPRVAVRARNQGSGATPHHTWLRIRDSCR